MNRGAGNRIPTRENRWNDNGETRIAAGETIPFSRRPHGSAIAVVIALLFLASIILSPHAGAEAVAGISPGPARACPDPGCTCMPEEQAGTLGYIRCSVNETPCFRDSFGRPLYCYRAPSSITCDAPPCNESDRTNGSSAEILRLVITMQAPEAESDVCGQVVNDACALPGAESASDRVAVDPFGGILQFFRSLFGMQ